MLRRTCNNFNPVIFWPFSRNNVMWYLQVRNLQGEAKAVHVQWVRLCQDRIDYSQMQITRKACRNINLRRDALVLLGGQEKDLQNYTDQYKIL